MGEEEGEMAESDEDDDVGRGGGGRSSQRAHVTRLCEQLRSIVESLPPQAIARLTESIGPVPGDSFALAWWTAAMMGLPEQLSYCVLRTRNEVDRLMLLT